MAKVRLRDLNPAKFLNKLEVDGGAEIVGSVGVGTGGTVTDKLEVVGAVRISNLSADKKIHFLRTGGNEFSFEHDTSSFYLYNRTSATELFTILNGGNIGIGQGAPSEVLTINSASNTRILLQEGGSSKGSVSAGGSGLYIRNHAGRILFRNSSDADTMAIWDDGKVGIGTGSNSLSHPFEIWDGTPEINLKDTSSSGQLRFSLDGVQAAIKNFSSGGVLELLTSGGGDILLSPSGKVSISGDLTVQTSDQADLLIGSTGGARAILVLDGSANGDGLGGDYAYLAHETDGRLTIANSHAGNVISLSGKIGIATGSNTPNEKLHVVSAGSGSSGYNSAETRGILITDNLGPRVVFEDIGEGVDNKVMSLRNEDQCFKIASMSDNGNSYESPHILAAHRDGHVGIGVVPSSIGANVAVLNVNGGGLFNASVCLRYGFTNSNYSLFQTNGQTLTISNVGSGTGTGDGHIILNTSRNVGVGAFAGTEPEYNLHVEGTLYANTISVGSGFNNLINAGQLTSRKNSSGQTADTDAALVIEQNVNPILEFLTDAGGNGTINFSSSTKGVAAIKVELPNKMQFWAGEALQLTLNQGGSNNVTFARLGAGTVQSDADGNLSVSSSAALKTEVRDFTGGLSSINNLRPVKFKWKQDTGLDYHNDYVGFIAEEVEEELPDAVLCPSECCDNDEMVDNHKSKGLSDRAMIAALVNAVQELSTRVQQLENS